MTLSRRVLLLSLDSPSRKTEAKSTGKKKLGRPPKDASKAKEPESKKATPAKEPPATSKSSSKQGKKKGQRFDDSKLCKQVFGDL